MSQSPDTVPTATRPADGVVHVRSPHTVADTVASLSSAIRVAGATLFAVVDHSGEAARAGLSLRDTKLLIFGNPVAGTPIMVAAPLAALDLPLKVLVWEDGGGTVWMSYLDPGWLAARHGLTGQLAAPLSAPAVLTGRLSAAGP
jgi:uncharacterized protein (DUF302 family)